MMTEEEYQKLKKRLEKGAEILEGRWFENDPDVQRWVAGYEGLAVKALNYEIENDLLPI